MKFIISNKILKDALKKIGGVITKNSVLPILGDVLFKIDGERLTVTCTDLEVTISIDLTIESKIEQFTAAIPFHWLFSICNLHGDVPLVFFFNKGGLKISGDDDQFEQKKLADVKAFPELPKFPEGEPIKLEEDFIAKLNAALTTCGADEMSIWMPNVSLIIEAQKIDIASSNASILYTYAFKKESSEGKTEVMLRRKMVKALSGFKETAISWNENHFAFISKNVTVIATRPEGKYPNYKAVIPSFGPNLTIGRWDLIESLNKASLVDDSCCQFGLIEGQRVMKISASNIDLDREVSVNVKAETPYTGTVETIRISPTSFLKLLSQVEYDKVSLAIHDSAKAILMTSEEDSAYIGLLMPIH